MTTRQSTVWVIVHIEDENDNPPTFPEVTYRISLPERDRNKRGEPVYRVFAYDRDLGANGNITYSIVDGNDDEKFSIDPRTAMVSSKKMVTAGSYDILTVSFMSRDFKMIVFINCCGLFTVLFNGMKWHLFFPQSFLQSLSYLKHRYSNKAMYHTNNVFILLPPCLHMQHSHMIFLMHQIHWLASHVQMPLEFVPWLALSLSAHSWILEAAFCSGMDNKHANLLPYNLTLLSK